MALNVRLLMDKSEVQDIVSGAIEKMKDLLYLNDWQINIYYGHLGDNMNGKCERDISYRIADITLDPEELDSKEEVLDVLRHELLHLVIADFDLYKAAIHHNFDDNHTFAGLYFHAAERVIGNIERMMDTRLKLTADKLIE